MLSRRLIALLAAPLMLPLMLGGCQTLESLGDHAAATVGLGDDTPRAYTANQISQAQHNGVVAADEPLAARAGVQSLVRTQTVPPTAVTTSKSGPFTR